MKSAPTAILLACALSDCTLPLALQTMPASYTPGSLAKALPSTSHALDTLDCVDVAMSLAPDGARTSLEWRMGNRCDRPVDIDTSFLVVTARSPDEAETLVAFIDPSRELGPHPLEPRRTALDRIGLAVPDRADRVCVSYNGVVPQLAKEREPACFAWRYGWVVARG
jgi:hypothetical protein